MKINMFGGLCSNNCFIPLKSAIVLVFVGYATNMLKKEASKGCGHEVTHINPAKIPITLS